MSARDWNLVLLNDQTQIQRRACLSNSVKIDEKVKESNYKKNENQYKKSICFNIGKSKTALCVAALINGTCVEWYW